MFLSREMTTGSRYLRAESVEAKEEAGSFF